MCVCGICGVSKQILKCIRRAHFPLWKVEQLTCAESLNKKKDAASGGFMLTDYTTGPHVQTTLPGRSLKRFARVDSRPLLRYYLVYLCALVRDLAIKPDGNRIPVVSTRLHSCCGPSAWFWRRRCSQQLIPHKEQVGHSIKRKALLFVKNILPFRYPHSMKQMSPDHST